MRNLLHIFLLSFFVLSCKNNPKKNFETLILGDWSMVQSIEGSKESIHKPLDNSGYIFYENNICEFKSGYFDYNRDRNYNIFLGTKTKYKIENDSLKIYDLTHSMWQSWYIIKMDSNFLTLQTKDDVEFKLKKEDYQINEIERAFDKIIVSSSICFGTCPVGSTLIDANGDFIFFGESFNQKNGYFNAKGNQAYFAKAALNFKKANFNKLQGVYSEGTIDGENIYVSFVKNNKIIKTIWNNDRIAPKEFFWAYFPIMYAHQQIKLNEFEKEIPEHLKIGNLSFEMEAKWLHLQESESFYLWSLLYKSKITNQKFEPKYNLHHSGGDNILTIKTNGQLYLFELKNQKKITVDLGHNFIKLNDLDKRFEVRKIDETHIGK